MDARGAGGALERDLRLAIAQNELQLVYQPIVTIRSAEDRRFRSLLRWHHPDARPHLAGRVHSDRRRNRPDHPDRRVGAARRPAGKRQVGRDRYKMAVNVSPMQIPAPQSSPMLVHAHPAGNGLSPSRLELEITETVLIDDCTRALAHASTHSRRWACHRDGRFRHRLFIAVLPCSAFPFDKIKIDRQFVEQLNDRKQEAMIVRCVLGLGRSLEIPVMAEGVETAGPTRIPDH